MMTQPQFQIRHGELEDITGPARRHGDVAFVPARVTLLGRWFSPCFPLQDRLADVPPAVRAAMLPEFDAAWVLGRLMALFFTTQTPEDERAEKTCFTESFVAVFVDRGNLAVPFECDAVYGVSRLIFSTDDPPGAEVQAAIADAFWGLLLSSPADLQDYQDNLDHVGAGVRIAFGVENGVPFMFEE